MAFSLCVGQQKTAAGVGSRVSCSTACQQGGVRVVRKRDIFFSATSYLQGRRAAFHLPDDPNLRNSRRRDRRAKYKRIVRLSEESRPSTSEVYGERKRLWGFNNSLSFVIRGRGDGARAPVCTKVHAYSL